LNLQLTVIPITSGISLDQFKCPKILLLVNELDGSKVKSLLELTIFLFLTYDFDIKLASYNYEILHLLMEL
jgi:hypothetical protein